MPAPLSSPEEFRLIARNEFHQIFFRLGYDLSSPEEMRRLEQNLRWAEEHRRWEVKRSASVSRATWLLVSAFLGSAATAIADYLSRK